MEMQFSRPLFHNFNSCATYGCYHPCISTLIHLLNFPNFYPAVLVEGMGQWIINCIGIQGFINTIFCFQFTNFWDFYTKDFSKFYTIKSCFLQLVENFEIPFHNGWYYIKMLTTCIYSYPFKGFRFINLSFL